MDTNGINSNLSTPANAGLAELKNIHLPEAVSIFPLAYGWYILLAIILLGALVLWWWLAKQKRKQRQISEIYRLLMEIENNTAILVEHNELLAKVTIFLKRVAQLKYPEQNPQQLLGEQWLNFLDSSGKTDQFTHGGGRVLLNLYQRDGGSNYTELFLVVRNWLKVVL
jgi:hypothetical protein